MTNDELISTLNDLIETCKDGEEGFKSCSEDARDAYLKTVLATRSRNCIEAARELQSLVRTLGGKPASTSSVSGALHRRWIDIKSAILGKDDEAILNECERGEDVAVRSYRNALEKDLSPEIRRIVERQYQGVLQNHDMVKSLRDRLHAHS
jgi:uncharacterized protein (TIGR02284 family)